jgi:hypothetical protein
MIMGKLDGKLAVITGGSRRNCQNLWIGGFVDGHEILALAQSP